MKNIIILALFAVLIWFGTVIVRLENYRYANSLGMCSEYGSHFMSELIARETCLNQTNTRTNPFWHLAYALGII